MLAIKQTVSGIDYNIQSLQKDLYAIVPEVFGINQRSYNCYGRCKRLDTNGSVIPACFVKGKDYVEVFGTDKVLMQSFFGLSSNTRQMQPDGTATADVHLIFHFSDITKLGESVKHSPDEEIVTEMLKHQLLTNRGFTVTGIVTGINDVFKEYSGFAKDGLKNRDMHPNFFLRFNLNVVYNYKATVTEPDYDTTNFINAS